MKFGVSETARKDLLFQGLMFQWKTVAFL